MTFTISYTGVLNNISVDWATANGTATAGADYTASSGTATFLAAGPRNQTITIPVIGDLLDEANETFVVNLTNPQPPAVADITAPTGTGTITDNDPLPSVVINDVSLTEGNAGDGSGTGTIENDDRFATQMTLRALGRHHHITSRGRLVGAEQGMRVRLVLLRKRGGGFVRVARARVNISFRQHGRTSVGIFSIRFRHDPRGRYVVRAFFRGDATHLPSRDHAHAQL